MVRVVNVGFKVKRGDHRLRLANIHLGSIDRLGDFGSARLWSHRDLGRTQDLFRTEVQRLHMNDRSTPGVPVSAPAIRATASGLAASPSSRLLVSIARAIATATSSRPIMTVPITSKMPLWVSSVMPTPNSAKIKPSSAAKSSSKITGSSGALAARMNLFQVCLPRVLLDSLMAVRNERLSATIAATRITTGTHHHLLSSSSFG